MADGLILTYDKVKMPKPYISGLSFKNDIVRIEIDGEAVWSTLDEGSRYWEE
jgi:hypothetical protein